MILSRFDLRSFLLRVSAAAFMLAAAMALVAIFAGDFGDLEMKVAFTAVGAWAMTLVVAPGLLTLERGPDDQRWRTLAIVAVALASLAFTLIVFAIWSEPGFDAFFQSLYGALILSIVCSFSLLLEHWRRPEDGGTVETLISATTAIGAVLGAVVLVSLLFELGDDDSIFRAVGALAVLTVLGVALVPIARRLDHEPVRADRQPTSAYGGASLARVLSLERAERAEVGVWRVTRGRFERALERAGDLNVVIDRHRSERGDPAELALLRSSRETIVLLVSDAEE